MIVDWADKPTELIKTDIAAVILAGTGYERCPWSAPVFPGVVIDGNGWEPITGAGCRVRYSLKVSCLYSSSTPDNFEVVEEMARQVFCSLVLANLGFDKIGPVGVFEVFGQKFAGAQMVTHTQITLLEAP